MKNNVSLSPGEIGYFTYTPESDFYSFFILEYLRCRTVFRLQAYRWYLPLSIIRGGLNKIAIIN